MQISSKFTIAIHIFSCIYVFEKKQKITSEFLASSTNINPAIIRKILQQLKAHKLVKITRGVGGASINKPLEEISFYDIYRALEGDKEIFSFHKNPNMACTIGKNIHNVLDNKLNRVQNALEDEMKQITLKDVINDLGNFVSIDI